MPPDNDFETFSREFDRVFSEDGPTPDGAIRTNIIPPIDQTVITADRAEDWTVSNISNMFSTPFIEYAGTGRLETATGRLETDGVHVRIQGLDLVDVIRQLSSEDKRKVLELLFEAFDEAPEEKFVTVKKVNRLRELLMYSKKKTS